MSDVGDLRTVMSLEDFEFHAGLRRAGSAAKQFGGEMAGGLGRSLGQVGFALQDFTSVLSMGGKNALGRALMSTMNNVQMLGAAFGPMGMAATAVGGAIASMLIPKFFEAEKASEDVANAIKDQIAQIDKLSSKYAQMAGFSHRVQGASSVTGAESILDDLDRQEKALKFREQRLEQLGRNVGQDLFAAGKVELPDAFRDDSTGAKLANLRMKNGEAATPELEEAKRLGNELLEIEMKRRDLAIERDAAEKKRNELQEQAEFQGGLDAAIAEQKKLAEEENKRLKIEREIAKEVQTPFEAAQEKIERLKRLHEDKIIGDDLFERATGKALEDFEKTQPGEKSPHLADQRNAGVAAGSSAAYETFRDAIREQDRANAEPEERRNKLLEEQVQLLKEQIAATKENGVEGVRLG